jgi:multisubunit Na+/H+ antiporter MnhB subunit
MTMALWSLDLVLAFLLVGLAWRALETVNLLEAVILFIALGLTLALTWIRLGATDIAIAEAALGAGVTGALFLNALRRLAAKQQQPSARRQAGGAGRAGYPGGGAFLAMERRSSPVARWLVTAGAAVLAGGLAWTLLAPVDRPIRLPLLVQESLDRSGVENPVTAVLLSFRAYDTLMEVAVLLVVASALWALDPRETVAGPDGGTGLRWRAPAHAADHDRDALVGALLRVVVPLIVLTGAYLTWAGARVPGGAFQAGALLGGGGVLLLMAGRLRVVLPPVFWLRAGIAAGFVVFLLVGAVSLAFGDAFLHYPPAAAYSLILAIEAGLTVSIAVVLVALFAEVPALTASTESEP